MRSFPFRYSYRSCFWSLRWLRGGCFQSRLKTYASLTGHLQLLCLSECVKCSSERAARCLLGSAYYFSSFTLLGVCDTEEVKYKTPRLSHELRNRYVYISYILIMSGFHANQTTTCRKNQGRTKGEGWSTAN